MNFDELDRRLRVFETATIIARCRVCTWSRAWTGAVLPI